MEGSFLVRLIYDDEITYNLIETAEKVLSKLHTFPIEFLHCFSLCDRHANKPYFDDQYFHACQSLFRVCRHQLISDSFFLFLISSCDE